MKIALFQVSEEQKKFFKENLTDHEVVFIDEVLDDEHLPSRSDFEIASVFVKCKISKKVLEALPNLRLITLRSTGFDNIDLDYAKERQVTICNVPAYGSHTVAEFTFGLILSLTRNIPEAVKKIKEDDHFSYTGFRGSDLYGKTLGVVGTGKIGVNVIKIAKSFGMNIYAFDTHENEGYASELGFQYVPLNTLLKDSDIVTLHTPATPETNNLINQSNIGQMKRSAFLINTSRGSVIETEALVAALENKLLQGAAVDVLESEDKITPIEEKLIKLDNAIVTPHMAFYTKEAELAIMQTTVDNINGFLSQKSQNVVNK